MMITADQVAHAAQRAHVVVDVLQHVVRHGRAVVAALGVRQQHLPDLDVRVLGEPLLEPDQAVGVRLGGGDAGDVLGPLEDVVAQPAADLDGVVTEVGHGELDEPATVVDRRRESFEHLRLDALIPSDFCHASIPHDMTDPRLDRQSQPSRWTAGESGHRGWPNCGRGWARDRR
jgi:hypothetical protein